MLSSEDIAELTGLIYGSIFEEQQWVPLMNRMADVVGGGATALICKSLSGIMLFSDRAFVA